MANEKPTSCTKSFKHESFLSFVILFIAICLIVCIVSQVSVCVYIYHKFSRLDKRVDDFGSVLEHILDESSSKLTSNQTALNENGEVVRERRSLQKTNTNLQGLVQRLNVMEKRYADPGGGGVGTTHMKGVGMLLVSLRTVNFEFWSHLGCSGQNAIIFSREGLD